MSSIMLPVAPLPDPGQGVILNDIQSHFKKQAVFISSDGIITMSNGDIQIVIETVRMGDSCVLIGTYKKSMSLFHRVYYQKQVEVNLKQAGEGAKQP